MRVKRVPALVAGVVGPRPATPADVAVIGNADTANDRIKLATQPGFIHGTASFEGFEGTSEVAASGVLLPGNCVLTAAHATSLRFFTDDGRGFRGFAGRTGVAATIAAMA